MDPKHEIHFKHQKENTLNGLFKDEKKIEEK